jgi:hypothetical protein
MRFMTDVRGACKVCGYVSHLGAVAQHHIIPKDVTKQAGMPESATVNLCCNCHFELYTWYRTKVTDMVYDPETKRFRDKPWDEKVKDYESAFNEFRKYKHEQKKSVRESK